MRYLTILLTTTLISLSGYSQTTIIIKRTKNTILLAADTKVRNYGFLKFGDIEKKLDGKTEVYRKIGGGKKVYFAVSGNFIQDIFKIADSACKKSKTIIEAVSSFYSEGEQRLSYRINEIRSSNIEEYNNTFKNKEIFAVWFCSVEQDTAKFIELKIRVEDNEEGFRLTPVLFEVPEVYEMKYRATGHINGIADSVALDKTWVGKDPIKTAIRLIKKQADTTPDFVAPPIDILILTGKSAILKRYN